MSVVGESIDQEGLADAIREARAALTPDRRLRVAIVGAPGSGKSTLAAALAESLNADEQEWTASVVPMDGFHLDDRLLERAGLRSVKGAPETFDVDGLATLLRRLADRSAPIFIPVFDRERELSRAAADVVSPSCGIALVEGNYLLLDRPGWRALHDMFDLAVMLDVPETVLRERLMTRWRTHDCSDSEATRRTEENDLPNGRVVRDESIAADHRYEECNDVVEHASGE